MAAADPSNSRVRPRISRGTNNQSVNPSINQSINQSISQRWPPSYHAEAVQRQCAAISLTLSPRFLLDLLEPTQSSHSARQFLSQSINQLIEDLVETPPFLFGSVPLRTYLPSGDIDIGVAIDCPADTSVADAEVATLQLIKQRLEEEEARSATDSRALPIHDITLITAAEIKLVKFNVGTVNVDISANTIGALATVCALEDLDREIDAAIERLYSHTVASCTPHLFKRSVLLIKAWCLCEAGILASHASALSTYAIETLIVYCINHYHHLLQHTEADPFLVLSVFVHVFAHFNFEEWCVTVSGPVRIADTTQPEFAAHHLFALSSAAASIPPLLASPFPHSAAPLLSPAYFYSLYINYTLHQQHPPRSFVAKHINIVDPLDLSNNLGRSVSFAALWKIRIALKQACAPLDSIIASAHSIADDLVNKCAFSREQIDELSEGDMIQSSGYDRLPESLRARMKEARQEYQTFFTSTLATHSTLASQRPDVQLAQTIKFSRALEESPVLPPLITPTKHMTHASTHPSASHRFFPLPHHSNLSRDDSSITSLRSPMSGRSLFINTIPAPDAPHKGHEGSFSPLIEPASCPPGSSAVSPSPSQPNSPQDSAAEFSPAVSPQTNDVLTSSLATLNAQFQRIRLRHRPSSFNLPPPFSPAPFMPELWHQREAQQKQQKFSRSSEKRRPAARRSDRSSQQPSPPQPSPAPTEMQAHSVGSSSVTSPVFPVASPCVSSSASAPSFSPPGSPVLPPSTHHVYPQRFPNRRQYVHSPNAAQTNHSIQRAARSSLGSGLGSILATNANDTPEIAAKVSAFLATNDEDSLAQAVVSTRNVAKHHFPTPPKGERRRQNPKNDRRNAQQHEQS